MEDSFRVRVDKAFGSIAPPPPSSSSASASYSLWCLDDEEIERREWNRCKHDIPDDGYQPYCPPNLDGFVAKDLGKTVTPPIKDFREALESDLQDLDEDEEDDDDEKRKSSVNRSDGFNDEELDIRSSIGMDSTLENEEEEDDFDKVAIGRKDAENLLYTAHITDYNVDINSHNELPNTIRDVPRDPRADHMAAKVRLREDAEAAGNFDSLRVSKSTATSALDSGKRTSEDEVNLKPILKRGNQTVPKSDKKVRFDTGSKDNYEEESEKRKNSPLERGLESEAALFQPQVSSGVPDYVRNPQNYTHYTFDSSSDNDEESNQRACMDFLNSLKGQNVMGTEDDMSVDLPKSVTFTPKKLTDASVTKGNQFMQIKKAVRNEYLHKNGSPIAIPAVDAKESEVCAMDEDEPDSAVNRCNSLQRPGRQYRRKASAGS